MRNILNVGVLLLIHLTATNLIAAEIKPMVYAGENGKLIYNPDSRGNRIPDFSRCGYMGGGVLIPTPPVWKHLGPIKGDTDDPERIQAAVIVGHNT